MADEHRTRLRGLRTGRHIDPSQSDDPRIRRVLDELAVASRSYATITAPASFRDELRTQLVAITPRITSETTPSADPTPATRQPACQPAPARRRRRRSIRLARPLAVVGSLVVVLAVVLGGAVWFSRDAVPGDTLYGLKRTSERVQLAFAGNDTDRAHDYLDLATTRVDEARTLVRRASASASGQGTLADGRLSPQTQRQVADVLGAADDNTRDAVRLLGRTAVDDGSAKPLDVIISWGPQQRARLGALSQSIPAGSEAGSAAARSTTLLDAARARASWVRQNLGCDCLRTHGSDSLGPAPGPATSGKAGVTSNSPAPKRSSTPGRTEPGKGATSTSPRGGGSSRSANPSATPAPTRSRPSQPPLPLPTPPKSTKTPKRSLCHVDLLGLRLCPSPSSS